MFNREVTPQGCPCRNLPRRERAEPRVEPWVISTFNYSLGYTWQRRWEENQETWMLLGRWFLRQKGEVCHVDWAETPEGRLCPLC